MDMTQDFGIEIKHPSKVAHGYHVESNDPLIGDNLIETFQEILNDMPVLEDGEDYQYKQVEVRITLKQVINKLDLV